MPEFIPSFPSGHVEFAVVCYGFLLYLSFSKPVCNLAPYMVVEELGIDRDRVLPGVLAYRAREAVCPVKINKQPL